MTQSKTVYEIVKAPVGSIENLIIVYRLFHACDPTFNRDPESDLRLMTEGVAVITDVKIKERGQKFVLSNGWYRLIGVYQHGYDAEVLKLNGDVA